MGAVINLSIVSVPQSTPSTRPIGKQIADMIDNDMEWFAMFKTHITEAIDTTEFNTMLKQNKKLKAPTNILVAMKVLKESFGWTDKQLFTQSHGDIKLRFALGLSQSFNIPSMFVFKAFENMLEEHKLLSGKDLMKDTIENLAKTQAPVFKVGEKKLMLWATKVA